MRIQAGALALAAVLMTGGAPARASSPSPAASAGIAAAVADSRRPAADRARDADRKPAEMLAFAGVKPGQKVADLFPGGGYFTRLFSGAVGPTGAVYAVTFPYMTAKMPPRPGRVTPPPVSAEPGRGNVREVQATEAGLGLPAPVDIAFTAQNYHDVLLFVGPEGVAAFNKAVFAALKPGGTYVVLDHAGAPGLDAAGIRAVHRIDPAQVRREVTAAGFVFDGESRAVRNPADPKTANVFDPAIRGHTDQFVLRFRKPR